MFARKKWILLLVAGLVVLSACSSLAAGDDAETLQASGIVEAVQVDAASELPGRVAEVYVDEGDRVQTGDPLFRLEDDLLAAQRGQTAAAQDSARGGLALARANLEAALAAREAAELNVEAARLQFRQVLTGARREELALRAAAWAQEPPEEFDLPGWYFEKAEKIEAARGELQAAAEALEKEHTNFEGVIQFAGLDDFIAAEARLAQARAAFQIAQELLNRELAQNGEGEIRAPVRAYFDSVQAELDAAQLAYDQLLTGEATADVLEARARLSVAQARQDLAFERLNALLTGEDSPAVQAARLGVAQAEHAARLADAAIVQAEAGMALAEDAVDEVGAALDTLDVQIARLTVHAAVSGVVLVRAVEPGEIVAPGVSAFTIGLLDDLTITVYVPENRYGQIALGDRATVSADSFPGKTFEAVVTSIADQAEFTPRNVQTQEERITTVFAIELTLTDPESGLKPGMPADVQFGP